MTEKQKADLLDTIKLLTEAQSALDSLAGELRTQLHAGCLVPLEWAAMREANETIDQLTEYLKVYLD